MMMRIGRKFLAIPLVATSLDWGIRSVAPPPYAPTLSDVTVSLCLYSSGPSVLLVVLVRHNDAVLRLPLGVV